MRALAVISVLLITLSTAEAQNNYPPLYGAQGNGMSNPFTQRYYPAQRTFRPQQRVQQQLQGPADVLRKGINELRTFLTSGQGGNTGGLTGFVETRMAPYFDFNFMTKSSLGPTWRRMNPVDRDQAKAWLRQNFLAKLTDYVGDYRSSRIDVLAAQGGTSRGEMVVPVRVWRQSASPMSLNFRFYRSKGGWRIFDVSANGQSAIIFYRGYIKRMLRG